MSEDYRPFGSFLRFKECFADSLGHLYRAGEFDVGGIGRTVWLRVLDGPSVPADEVMAAFDRALAISEKIQSANVASRLECVVDDGTPAITTKFEPSQLLSLVFERARIEQFPVPVDNALLILEKISIALMAAGATEIDGERIVHGFLHPGLIFVTNDGEGVVSGFGFGEQLLALIDDPESTDQIHPYFAPEVLQTRSPSSRGDVYSLGAILFQLLTGSALPASIEDRAQAIIDGHLGDEERALPEDIRVVLQRALADRPEDRFSSAPEFKKELDRLLYGGAYSPTTFNLALFMDRLFRAEIEAEDAERAAEQKTDVTPYLAAAVETQPFVEAIEIPSKDVDRRNLWLGLAAAAVVVVASTVGVVKFMDREPKLPPPPPTPTSAEIAAQREAQDEKMRELAAGLVAEMMAAKEDEIRQELGDRQAKIEELQRRLSESERRAQQGRLTQEEERRQQELQRQIALEEEAQKTREAELEAERLRIEEEGRQQAAAAQSATPEIEEETAVAASLDPTPEATAVAPSPQPTAAPTAAPTRAVAASVTVSRNAFVDPTEVDSLPVVIRKHPVEWPKNVRLSQEILGIVIVQATVNADGKVDEVKVLRADHEGFGIPGAVVEAAKKYRFKPGIKDGVRIKTYATVTETYRFAR